MVLSSSSSFDLYFVNNAKHFGTKNEGEYKIRSNSKYIWTKQIQRDNA